MKLVIFDFDYSLIDENSDTFIVEKLAPALSNRFESPYQRWTQLMQEQLSDMWAADMHNHTILIVVI